MVITFLEKETISRSHMSAGPIFQSLSPSPSPSSGGQRQLCGQPQGSPQPATSIAARREGGDVGPREQGGRETSLAQGKRLSREEGRRRWPKEMPEQGGREGRVIQGKHQSCEEGRQWPKGNARGGREGVVIVPMERWSREASRQYDGLVSKQFFWDYKV